MSGCSGRAGIAAPDANAADVLEGGTDADWFCPGHLDPPLSAPYCFPSFTIKTSDGSRAIMSAQVVSDSCVLDPIAFPDGGIEGVATLLVYGNSYSCPASPCAVQVTLQDGRTVQVLAESQQGITVPYGHCARNTDCCDRSEYTAGTTTDCYWSPAELQVETIAKAGDGGALD
jgi:hypothetical protein